MKNVLCLIVLITLVLYVQPVLSQKAIQLTNTVSDKKLVLEVGHRVEYTLKSNPKNHYTGVIESVSEEEVTIQGLAIPYQDIKSIGRRRKGSGFVIIACTTVGTSAIISTFKSDDPCPNCIDEGSTGEGLKAMGGIVGAGLLALSINTVVRNSPKDLVARWTLEVVDTPAPTSAR